MNHLFPVNRGGSAVDNLVVADPTIGVDRVFALTGSLPQLPWPARFPPQRMAQGNLKDS